MTLLKNFDLATKYFEYISGTEIDEASDPKISGWYKFVNGMLSALLVLDNNLYFLYGEDEFLIKDTHAVVLKQISKFEGECNLINGNEIVVRFIYPLPDLKLNVSPFEYIDEEDFNWVEFTAKVINDQERKRNFIANLQ